MKNKSKASDYWVVFERCDDGSYNAYVPDLPGCVSVGDDLEDAKRMIHEAIAMHIESLREAGEPVPSPTTEVARIHAA